MNVCSICLDPVATDGHMTICHHQFHRTCITEWVTRNPSCPLCRYPCLLDTKTSFRVKLKRGKFLDRVIPQELQIGEEELTLVNRMGTVIEILPARRIKSVQLCSDRMLVLFRSLISGGKVLPIEMDCYEARALHAAIARFFLKFQEKYEGIQ